MGEPGAAPAAPTGRGPVTKQHHRIQPARVWCVPRLGWCSVYPGCGLACHPCSTKEAFWNSTDARGAVIHLLLWPPLRPPADVEKAGLQLRDLVSMLRNGEKDWKGQLKALRCAEALVRAAPDELEQYGGKSRVQGWRAACLFGTL